jgi:hypothetical protein
VVTVTSSGFAAGHVRNGRDYQRFYEDGGAAWDSALECLRGVGCTGEHSALLFCAKLVTRVLCNCTHPDTRASDWFDISISSLAAGTALRIALADRAIKPGPFSMLVLYPLAVKALRTLEKQVGLPADSASARDCYSEAPFEQQHIASVNELLGHSRGGGVTAVKRAEELLGPSLAAKVGPPGQTCAAQLSMLSMCIRGEQRNFATEWTTSRDVAKDRERSAKRRKRTSFKYGGSVGGNGDSPMARGPLGHLLCHPDLPAPSPAPAPAPAPSSAPAPAPASAAPDPEPENTTAEAPDDAAAPKDDDDENMNSEDDKKAESSSSDDDDGGDDDDDDEKSAASLSDDEFEPGEEDDDIFGGLGRVVVDGAFSQEDSEAAANAAGPTSSVDTGKVSKILVGTTLLLIDMEPAAPRVLKITPTHLRVLFRLGGSQVAFAAVMPWKRIEKCFFTAEGQGATLVLRGPPTFWCQHKESATKANAEPKMIWSQASVTDPTPGKVGSKCVMWTLSATRSGGFRNAQKYIEGLEQSKRPDLMPEPPAASDEVFAPAAPVAEGDEEVPRGVPLGAQTDVPHCRSHPKQVVQFLRKLDELLSDALERRPRHVPDVFDDEKTQQFMQVYRGALKKIVAEFHAEIARTPALVFGVASSEDLEPEE